jgi:acetyl esterase
MTLDPIMKAFLDQLYAQPGLKMYELPPAQAREMFVGLMQLAGPQNVPIGKVANLLAPGPGGEIPLRVYTPVGAGDGPLPTLVFFHGGGFVIGDLDTHDGLCRLIANDANVRVVAVDYRLAPEHKFPAAVDDAYAALTWVAANAEKLGVDASRLAVGGDSAGGNLTAVIAQMAKQKGVPKLAFQLLLFPATHIGSDTQSMRTNAEGYFLDRPTIDWFFGNYMGKGTDNSDLRLSPLLAKEFSGLPPAYLMTASYDPLHDEGIAYAEKLRAAGVPVTIADYPGFVHDFIYLQAVLPQAPEALRAASMALRSALEA